MRVEVYPVFSAVFYLDKFHNVDLTHRGYYQIQFRFKTTVPCFVDISYQASSSSEKALFSANVHDDCATSRTVEIIFTEESVPIGDIFLCKFKPQKHVDMSESLHVRMFIDLLFLKRDHPPRAELFSSVSKRVMDIRLRTDRSLHICRPIFFHYTALSAVTIMLHASLVSVITKRKKLPPDPPISEKLRCYHECACRSSLLCCHSLQLFIVRHQSLIPSPVHIHVLNVEDECRKYCFGLTASENGWLQLERDAVILSEMLSKLFGQLIQLFVQSAQLVTRLIEEFDIRWMKKLGEGFFYEEDAVSSLLNSCDIMGRAQFVADFVRKNSYLCDLPKEDFYCAETDVDSSTMSIIIEYRYLPTSPSRSTREKSPETSLNSPASKSPVRKLHMRPFIIGHCLPLKSSRQSEPYMISYKTKANSDLISTALSFKHSRRMTDPGNLHNRSKSMHSLSDNLLTRRHRTKSAVEFRGKYPTGPEVCSQENPSNTEVPGARNASEYECSGNDLSANQQDVLSHSINSNTSDIRPFGMALYPDHSTVQFAHRKEDFKRKLFSSGFTGSLYSDLNRFPNRQPYFISRSNSMSHLISPKNTHLVVLVHGLEGGTDDLASYRNYLRLTVPNDSIRFLSSQSNRSETWTDLNQLAANLFSEILSFIESCYTPPTRISFIAHSMGGIIVRCMLGDAKAVSFLPKFHVFLTLNTPHCGLLYNQKAANWGVSLIQWWKQSTSLEQLTLRDTVSFRDTFLYRLSMNGVLSLFKYVLLVGSHNDLYVPCHSSLINYCKATQKDPSLQGTIYEEMVTNLNESVIGSAHHTSLIKYMVFHSFANTSRGVQMSGRAAHCATVDDDLFIEKFIAVSGFQYFI
ncbi:hypothetical protein AB6A40_001625 [Gnathostoma spinigerum]|uniref:DUF676 domain-containing protein n=1 Tax=Gnathostoma spinigerum TaxID=75299 RepID=A0ABD6E5V5_9BILA